MNIPYLWAILILIGSSYAVKLKRCVSCRSRGDQGSCKDPLPDLSKSEDEKNKTLGVEVIPCASGWCGKTIEGGGTFRDNDYAQATERLCLQRGPSDEEERCAYTLFKNRKVYMCFCQGDLCNNARTKHAPTYLFIISFFATIIVGNIN